jgi:hypothetical protein
VGGCYRFVLPFRLPLVLNAANFATRLTISLPFLTPSLKYIYSNYFFPQTLAVEFFHIKEGKDALDEYMEQQGYRNEGQIFIDASTMPYDVIYSKI